MTTVFLDAHKVPLDPYTAASGMGLHTDQHGGAKVSHIGCSRRTVVNSITEIGRSRVAGIDVNL